MEKFIMQTETFYYLSVEKSIIRNAERHKANAEKYLAEGNIHHAIGSFKKMVRNYERSQMFTPLKFNGMTTVDMLSNKIADDILNGSSSFIAIDYGDGKSMKVEGHYEGDILHIDNIEEVK